MSRYPVESWPNRQIYGPDIQLVGQMEGYLGQAHRSRSLGDMEHFMNLSPAGHELIDGIVKDATGEYNCRNMKQGLSKVHVFLLRTKFMVTHSFITGRKDGCHTKRRFLSLFFLDV